MGSYLSDHAPGRVMSILCMLVLLSACTTTRPGYDTPEYNNANYAAFVVNNRQDEFSRFAPVFIPAGRNSSFNRIGNPEASQNSDGREVIRVDPDEASVFVDRQYFSTERGRYTNLIYRIHFEKTPFSLLPFHLTAGKNNGLLAIITLDASSKPILLTTVHTCGCYLAFTPTSFMPGEYHPDDWTSGSQDVYGMSLPGQLEFSEPFDPEQRFAIFLQEETHRVMDIDVQTLQQVRSHNPVIPLEIAPVDDLRSLPLGDSGNTTSFFETEGDRKGYVKGAYKPFERLFMSWWSLDWRVGEDKAYGDRNETGTVFYTSLKPWNRYESDMWPFADFLEFWGWGL